MEIFFTKASDAELWCFLWSAPEQTVEQTREAPVILDAIALIMTSLLWVKIDLADFTSGYTESKYLLVFYFISCMHFRLVNARNTTTTYI